MIEIRNDQTGELIGMATSYVDGKLHGRAYNFLRGTQTIYEDHNYINGAKHGPCTRHLSPYYRVVEHYEHGRLTRQETVFETGEYLCRIETRWEEGREVKKTTKMLRDKFCTAVTETEATKRAKLQKALHRLKNK